MHHMRSRPYLSSPLLVRVLLLAFTVTCCLSLSTGGVGGQTSSDDHGDTIHTATDLPLGSSVGGRIDPGDDQDVFRLDLSRESSDTDLWIYATGDLDTFGELLTSAGEVIVSNDDGYIVGRRNAFHIRWNLSPGVYYVRVGSSPYLTDPNRRTGDYTLHAQAVTAYPGSTTGTATALELDSPTPGMIDSATEAEYFRLDLTDSKDMFIYATGLDMFDQDGPLPFNPVVLEALDSRGTEIPVNVDYLPVGARIQDDFAPGTYYIKVITPEQSEYFQDFESSYPVPYTIHAYEDTDYTIYIEGCNAETSLLNKSPISDALYGCQWHLNNRRGEDINVEAVWEEGITGKGVNVAVVDDGMDHRHEDLRNNVDESRNHDYSDRGDVHHPYMHHGTNVAGIIAAGQNGVGVSGVAPGATVYGYNFLAADTDVAMADSMGRNREVTAVSNNSWGSVGYIGLAPRIWELAVDAGIREGHDGKGVFYAFAAGNGYFGGNEANLGEVGNYYGVTAVCAVGDDDVRSPYSETGANLWVCAPSNGADRGILTTENSDRYNPRFGGTSAATPIVSGVVALMREANPDLTWRDLKLILAASARKNDAGNIGWEDGAHKYGAESDTDRYHFNHEYGFGMVDAKAAVALARGWSNLPPFESSAVESNELNLPVPDAPATGDPTALESTLVMTTSVGFIEFVEVDLSFEHDAFRNLDIELVSPSGSVSKLVGHFNTYERFGEYVPLHNPLRFGSARHLGEDPNGEWKLRVADRIPTMAGSLASWNLTVYGHESTPGPPIVDWITTGDDSLIVGWVAPTQTGGSAVTAYDLRYILASADETVDSNWTVVEDAWTANSGGNLEYTITGLLRDIQYDLQVRAVNEIGPGRWSKAFTATTTQSPCNTGGAVADPDHNPGLVSDCRVLMEARDALVGSGSLNWSAGTSIATWDGVKMDGTPKRVVELSLRNRGLTGVIPTQLGSLINLQGLSLGGNQLTGEIPAALGSLAKLKWLYLNGNRLTGEIPAALGRLANLTELELSSNRLSGEIPDELRRLAALAHLSLRGNALSGEIPAWLGNLANLHSLLLSGNSFTGCIPEELQDLAVHDLDRLSIPFCGRAVLVAIYNATDGPNWANNTNWLSDRPIGEWYGVSTDANGRVVDLSLRENELTGEIPTELGSLSSLQSLELSSNQLTGAIPAELENLSDLQGLSLFYNQLTGEIPLELGSLSNLQWLDLAGNQLMGEIPPELGSLSNLQRLSLAGNQLMGAIPTELGSLSSLTSLSLSGNELSGAIPKELGSLSSLRGLSLWGNELSGAIPKELGSLSSLQGLSLWGNELSGEIPKELGSLSSLQDLSLWGNELSGEIPKELGSLSSLQDLSLWGNELSGEIPKELGSLSSLQDLSLWGNELSGELPKELGSLSNLQWLRLNNNQLTGEIPTELGSLSNLESLSLWGNELTGGIPAELADLTNLQQLDLSSNQLTGEIPPELGSLANLTNLGFWRNQLTGGIPAELADLTNLQQLDLSSNQLTGGIPAELADLTNLQQLDLSSNQLTGGVPAELADLTNLQRLFLSDNQLTGCIPVGLRGVADDRADNNPDHDLDRLGLPICDVLLSGLSISPRTLTPSFDPYETVYTAIEGPTSVTVTATSEHGADIRFLDQSDAEIPDADTSQDGLQIELDGPDKGIKIEVTSADGMAVRTYTILLAPISICVFGGAASDADNAGLVSDCEALLASRDVLTLNWSESIAIERWDGITVSGTPNRVTGVDLWGRQLTGEIPAEWGNLSNLERLYLSSNRLTGEIPAELGNLANLRSLYLSDNQLTGEIPSELGNLSRLWQLQISNNQLTGELPRRLTGITRLYSFGFYGNRGLCAPVDEVFQTWLNGIATVQGSSCASVDSADDRAVLVELYNSTGGANWANNTDWQSDRPIREWHGVTNDADGKVTGLYLSGNRLAGEIPAELGSLSNLERLFLSNNRLNGEIPAELGSQSSLTQLSLGWNQLTGEIPSELGNLSRLWQLQISNNQLTGEIPAELGNLSNLSNLVLSSNQLTGEIPSELGNLSRLWQLQISNNQLTGEIPAELGDLSNLGSLYLSSNQLTGSLPSSLTQLTSLEIFAFGENAGLCAPTDAAFQTWLQGIPNNYLPHGVTPLGPSCSTELTDREILEILYNATDGPNWTNDDNWADDDKPLGEWYGVITDDDGRVTDLSLSQNGLTGEIPTELGDLSNLEDLYLSGNQLTGCIPAALRDVPNNDLNQLGLPFCSVSSPGAPIMGAVAPGMDWLVISWSPPSSDGGSAIIAYDLRHIETSDDETMGSNWTIVEDVWTTGSGALEYTLTGLTADTQYDIQARAVNAVGDGPWSATATGTTKSASVCVAGGAVTDATNDGLIADCEALLAAEAILAVSVSLNWAGDTPIAQWDGIRLGGTPRRVTRLALPGKGLGGTVPSQLGELSMLTDLNLRTNGLSGQIPIDLGDLSNLVRLNLHTNQLTGPIPDLGGLTGLEEMYLARNMLTGPVPAWLNGMTEMRELWLWGNELSGTIPDLSGMTSLEKLKLAANNLEGGVPGASALPANLRWLIIQENPLGGTIPDLSGMTRLAVLWLHTNGLTGEVPASHLPTSLTSLNLHSNQLSGEIPDLSGLDRLQWLRLQGNQLSGTIPSTLGDMESLTRLWLHENMLSGTIPAWLGGLTKLQRLWLSDNMLSGEIPEELGELGGHSLVQWRLGGNALTGCVPAGLADVTDGDLERLGLLVCSDS